MAAGALSVISRGDPLKRKKMIPARRSMSRSDSNFKFIRGDRGRPIRESGLELNYSEMGEVAKQVLQKLGVRQRVLPASGMACLRVRSMRCRTRRQVAALPAASNALV